MRTRLSILVCLITLGVSHAANLANPAFNVNGGRLGFGVSYHLGGYTITNEEVPCLLNRVHGRLIFSPIPHFDLGIDLGIAQMDVDSYIGGGDTIPLFHGGVGFSGAAQVKGTTPFFLNEMVAGVLLVQGGLFSSENEYGALYKGYDGSAALGIQVKIQSYGYISAGVKAYYIQGSNRHYTDSENTERSYSNLNNVGGWCAIDLTPELRGQIPGKPYFTIEISATPEATYDDRIPVQEFSISLSVGWISPRIFGEPSTDESF